MRDTDTFEWAISKVQYVKVSTRDDVETLASHYGDLGWRSNKYRKSLIDILKHFVQNESNFPFLVEHKDDFGWVEIGSYLSLGYGGLPMRKEKRMDKNINKYSVIPVNKLMEMHEIVNSNKKYYLLT